MFRQRDTEVACDEECQPILTGRACAFTVSATCTPPLREVSGSMAFALLLARLALTAAFAVAGVAKLLDRSGTREALREFGVPEGVVLPGGAILPLVELAVAALLIPISTAWVGAVAALALLLLFTAVVGLTLARGRRPECHCFGQLAATPVGWWTFARNAVLAALAGIVVAVGRGGAGWDVLGWLGGGTVSAWAGFALGMAALAVSGISLFLLLQLLAQNGRLLLRLESLEQRLAQALPAARAPGEAAEPMGLPVGSRAPDFRLPDLSGETVTLAALLDRGKPLLLAYLDPGCGPCNALLPDLAHWQRELTPTVTLAVVSQGSIDANRAQVSEHGLTTVLVQRHKEVLQRYEVHWTPSMVLVQPDGTMGSPLAQGTEAMRALVARSSGQPLPPSAVPTVPPPAAG